MGRARGAGSRFVNTKVKKETRSEPRKERATNASRAGGLSGAGRGRTWNVLYATESLSEMYIAAGHARRASTVNFTMAESLTRDWHTCHEVPNIRRGEETRDSERRARASSGRGLPRATSVRARTRRARGASRVR